MEARTSFLAKLLGWMTLIKGLLFWFLPAGKEANFFLGVMQYQRLFYVYVASALLLGLWFTYRGLGVGNSAVKTQR